MTRETCGMAWWPSFFVTSFNRGTGRAPGPPGSATGCILMISGLIDQLNDRIGSKILLSFYQWKKDNVTLIVVMRNR